MQSFADIARIKIESKLLILLYSRINNDSLLIDYNGLYTKYTYNLIIMSKVIILGVIRPLYLN